MIQAGPCALVGDYFGAPHNIFPAFGGNAELSNQAAWGKVDAVDTLDGVIEVLGPQCPLS